MEYRCCTGLLVVDDVRVSNTVCIKNCFDTMFCTTHITMSLVLPSFQGHNLALLHRESEHTMHSCIGGKWTKMHGGDGDRGATNASTKDGIGLTTVIAKPFLGVQV